MEWLIFTHTTGGIRLYRGANQGLYTSFSVASNLTNTTLDLATQTSIIEALISLT